MSPPTVNPSAGFEALASPVPTFELSQGVHRFQAVDLRAALEHGGQRLDRLPYVTRILLENLLRSRALGRPVADEEIGLLLQPGARGDLPLYVTRVLLPDSSGLPVLQDLAALRDALARAGGDPADVDTRIPVDLIIDHSLQVDTWGREDAVRSNMRLEFERNAERYAFIGWAQQAFRGLKVYPPGSGILHQVNLEQIASVVARAEFDGQAWAFPDFVIGGDSHTPMVNGLGVLGWGVGGIDAEAAVLGHAYIFPSPDVVGVRLVGRPGPLVWTTDMALLITERLRREKVANCAVEYFGPAARAMTVPERATLANMSPEYGATCGFFPVDERTLDYLKLTGRSAAHSAFVEDYCRRVGLFRAEGDPDPSYARVIEIDLSEARPSVAGPSRPQDRLAIDAVPAEFRRRLSAPMTGGGFGPSRAAELPGRLPQGAVVIAAITSCTNTSNPQVMFAAGLVARNAVARGLRVPDWVKTSLAPGSPSVVRYLEAAGLMEPLQRLGFYVIGFGCTTCGGKSGPLAPEIVAEIDSRQLVATAVLSGNRNFAGRIHKLVRANFIGAPPMVVGYALAGRIDIDLDREPIGTAADGQPVFWRDLLPDPAEVQALVDGVGDSGAFGPAAIDAIPLHAEAGEWSRNQATGNRYAWDEASQYLREPPFFADDDSGEDGIVQLERSLARTRALAVFGDSLTTDHISPSGEIPIDTPAGRYLLDAGVAQRDFNTYVGRRGNLEVMVRGTFANVRLRNLLVPEHEGGWTLHLPDRRVETIFDAAQAYRRDGTAVIVLGGKEYGTGSSRDWAAKGSALLGVRAVIAESYERIHRANLIGMGVLPLRFKEGEGWRQLGLDGTEQFEFSGVADGVAQGLPIRARARRDEDGVVTEFEVFAEVGTAAERHLMAAGGLPRSVLHDLLHKAQRETTCA